MPIIDADAHVIENESAWDYMLESERQFRPKIVGATNGDPAVDYWFIDGRLMPRSNVEKALPEAARNMTRDYGMVCGPRWCLRHPVAPSSPGILPPTPDHAVSACLGLSSALCRCGQHWRGQEQMGIPPRAEINTADQAKEYLDMGVRHFCIGTDINILHQWWKAHGENLRKALEGA